MTAPAASGSIAALQASITAIQAQADLLATKNRQMREAVIKLSGQRDDALCLYRDARNLITAYLEEAAAATALAAKATPEANERYIAAMRNRRRLVSGWEAGNR